MKEKIIEAIRDMESKISRDSKHIYINNETGIRLQGVSTVSSIVPKDWLAAWGAKETVKALGYTDYEDTDNAANMLVKIKGLSLPQYLKLLKEVKGAFARKSKKALVDGKEGHEWLENAARARINDSTMPPMPINTPLERPLTKIIAWEKENVDYDIAAESLVCNLAKGYAGQLDKICMLKTGELALIDYKFSSHISEEYFLQTAGYSACFESYGIKIDKRIIIRLPKTLEKEEWNEKEHKYQMVPNDIEIKVISTNYESDRDAFYAALIVKGWINSVAGVDN